MSSSPKKQRARAITRQVNRQAGKPFSTLQKIVHIQSAITSFGPVFLRELVLRVCPHRFSVAPLFVGHVAPQYLSDAALEKQQIEFERGGGKFDDKGLKNFLDWLSGHGYLVMRGWSEEPFRIRNFFQDGPTFHGPAGEPIIGGLVFD